MKVYEEKTAKVQAVTQIKCNLCGCGIEKNELGYFNDHLSVEKTWNYHSGLDGCTHAFDICEKCYTEWMGRFKIPPERQETS